MAQDSIAALDEAIGKLESELNADPRITLLARLRAARSDYDAAAVAPPLTPAQPVQETARIAVADGPRLAPGRAQAFELCKKALIGHTSPVRTRALFDLVEEANIDLPGGMNNLSSLLGRHPKVFKSHGRQGWTLKDQGNGAEPNSVANGGGSAPLFNTSQEGGEGHEATTTH